MPRLTVQSTETGGPAGMNVKRGKTVHWSRLELCHGDKSSLDLSGDKVVSASVHLGIFVDGPDQVKIRGQRRQQVVRLYWICIFS